MSRCGFARILSASVGFAYVLTASTGAVSAITTLPASAVRDGFISCGFVPNSATVSANGTFAVVDPVARTGGQRRVLMVAVYTNAASAQDAYNHAAANTGSTTPEWNSDRGPLLYANYGPSVWRGNVSLSQSDLRMLSGLNRAVSQTGESVADSESAAILHDYLWHRTSAVDLDFVKCLDFVLAVPRAANEGENGVSATSASVVSARTRDTWYLEGQETLGAPAVSAQVRDTWYREPRDVGVMVLLSEISRGSSAAEAARRPRGVGYPDRV